MDKDKPEAAKGENPYAQYHVVAKDDTLSKIARKYYGRRRAVSADPRSQPRHPVGSEQDPGRAATAHPLDVNRGEGPCCEWNAKSRWDSH